MSTMTSQILKIVNSPKTQKSKYLENEKLFFFLKYKNPFIIKRVLYYGYNKEYI